MKKIFLLIALILSVIVNAKSIEISQSENSITISIRNLSDIFKQINLLGSDYLHFESKYSFPVEQNGVYYDILRIPIIIENKDFQLTYMNSQYINNRFEISVGTSSQEIVRLEYEGILREKPIYHLIINPFSSEVNGILNDLEIIISNVQRTKVIQNDLEFYSNIANNDFHIISPSNNKNSKSDNTQSDSWYSPEIDYLKIASTKDGLTEITVDEIMKLKQNWGNIKHKDLHLINKGEEKYLQILSNGDNISDINKIFFNSERAKGDTTWFNNYTDSNVYYIYIDETKHGLRYAQFPDISASKTLNFIDQSFHYERDSVYFWGDFDLQWDVENIHREKWIWKRITADGKDKFDYEFEIYPYDSVVLNINMESIVFYKEKMTKHNIRVMLNNDEIIYTSIDTGKIKDLRIKLPADRFNQGINSLLVINDTIYDANELIRPNDVAVDFIEITGRFFSRLYQKQLHNTIINLDDNVNIIYNIDENLSGEEVCIVDRNNHFFKVLSINDDKTDALSLSKDNDYELFTFIADGAYDGDISFVNNSDLRSIENQADALYITHPLFSTAIERLTQHRTNQGMKTIVVNVDDIYKEFNYGIKSPHAIKSFLKYTYENWQEPKPKFVTFVGDANWDSRNKLYNSVNQDFIPVYGWPASDYWYVLLDSAEDKYHDMFIGRLPVTNVSQLEVVIDKLIEYDSNKKHPWMKRFFSITGGDSESQRLSFKESMDVKLSEYWAKSPFSGDTVSIMKKDNIRETEATNVINNIDRGAVWVNFFGHGSPQVFDVDGWHADKLNNKGKYSFFTTISCNTAAFAEPQGISRDEEYLLQKDKGFIAAGGSTNLGVELPGLIILDDMLKVLLFSDDKPRTLGEILNNGRIRLLGSDILSSSFAKQYVLLGDPLTKIHIPTKSDLFIFDEELSITNPQNRKIFIDSDSSVYIKGWLYNNGFCEEGEVQIRLIHKYESEKDSSLYLLNDVCRKDYFEFLDINILDKAGSHIIELYIITTDTSFLDYSTSIDVYETGLLPVEPFSYWNVVPDELLFRFVNPGHIDNNIYEFTLSKFINGEEQIISESIATEISVNSTHIDWKPAINLEHVKNYIINSRLINTITNQPSQWIKIPFYTSQSSKDTVKINFQNEFLEHLQLENLDIVENENNFFLEFGSEKIPYSVSSAKGNEDTTRLAEIIFDDVIYISTPAPSNAPVGINLIVVSGDSNKVVNTKYFGTWDLENSSRDLVRFLNDSIAENDWLLLASCGSSWRMLFHTGKDDSTEIGSFYTFRKAMSKFGSKLSWQIPDSVDNPTVSFAFIGKQSDTTNYPIELMDVYGGLVRIEDNLVYPAKDAEIVLPSISGYSQLLDLSIESDSEISNNIQFYGTSNSPDAIDEYSNIKSINLRESVVNTEKYFTAKIKLLRDNTIDSLKMNSISIRHIPSPEIAVVFESSNTGAESVLRADSVLVDLNLINLSLRADIDSTDLTSTVNLISGNKLTFRKKGNLVQRNSTYSDSIKFSTLYFDTENNIITSVDLDDDVHELYSFNNSFVNSVSVLRDSILPRLMLKFDNIEIHDSSTVALKPKVEMILYDNSLEPILDDPFKIRFNGRLQTELNTFDYQLNILNLDTLKASLEFELDSIKDVDNIFEVYFSDAAGNIDTLEYHVFTTINAFIVDNEVYPNPFINHSTISFDYIAPDKEGYVIIDIFDNSGRRIRTLQKDIQIGKNEVYFDGKNSEGQSLSSGMYFYILQMISQNFSKPEYGKIIKTE